MTNSPHTPLRATWSSLQCLASLTWTPPSPTCPPSEKPQRPSSGEIPFILDSGISIPLSPTANSSRQSAFLRPLSQYSIVTDFTTDDGDMICPPSMAMRPLNLFVSSASVNTFGVHHSLSTSFNVDGMSDYERASHQVSSKLNQSPEIRYLSPSLIPLSTPAIQNSTFPVHTTPPSHSATSTPSTVSRRQFRNSSITTLPVSANNSPGIDIVANLDSELHISSSDRTIGSYVTACADPPLESMSSIFSFLALEDPLVMDTRLSDTILHAVDPEVPSAASARTSVYTDHSIVFAKPSLGEPATVAFPPAPGARKIVRGATVRRKALGQNNDHLNVQHPDTADQSFSPIIFHRSGNRSRTPSANGISIASSDSSLNHGARYPLKAGDTAYSLDLPPHLAWLSSISIELLIDQEHFREIRPLLRLSGMCAANGGQAMAEFKPVENHAYHFHHSSFDPDPVIRRLVVDGDEEHDGLSRLATLSLKGEGVYMVTGAETLRSLVKGSQNNSFHPFAMEANDVPSSKAPWKFVYAISDRLSTAGQPLPGEKTLTPLSFSCAPRLLHADVGHRVGLLQLARKAARTKLVAKRVGSSESPSHSPVPSIFPRPFARLKENMPPPQWSDVHSRQTSATPSDVEADDEKRGLIRKNTTRRRAASSASMSGPGTTRVFGHPFASGFALTDQNIEHIPSVPLLDQHILPQAELSMLITSFPKTPPPAYPLPVLPTDTFSLPAPPISSRSLTHRLGARMDV